MTAIIDYDIGNLRSVHKAFETADPAVRVITDPKEVLKADRLVLPGVGAFGDSMKNLERLGFRDAILEFAATGRPFLGVCVGLQLLFSESTEKGRFRGLGIIPGRIDRFEGPVKVPQIGWNQVRIERECPLFLGIPDNTYFYFVHSYFALPENPSHTAGSTDYGVRYASVAAKDRVFGVQFHPEKSQAAGLRIIENFCKI